MENAKQYRERVWESSNEGQFLIELYKRSHLLADLTAEQIFGPLMDQAEREDVIRLAFENLAGRVEMLRELPVDKQMKRVCIAVRDAALAENRKALRWKLTRWSDRRLAEEGKPTGGRMMPGVSEMVEDVVRDEWYLYAALRRMETREFTLLIEKYQNRLSDKEIGEKMGIKTRSVRIYMARARRKVTMYYKEEEANGERNKQQSARTGAQEAGEGV